MKVDFAQLYVKGARVWIADKQLVWRGAKLAEDLDQEKRILWRNGGKILMEYLQEN